jgi:hypothetical protein
LTRVITDDPETKQQSSQWKSPNSLRPEKKGETGQVKNMLIILFDIKGIVHKDFVLAGQTVVRVALFGSEEARVTTNADGVLFY